MIKRKTGKILNLSSVAAFCAGPKMSVYYASKEYVRSFSEALAEELKGTGVTVTALCPGPTRSIRWRAY
jgi:short-subunit dehydrogenase